MRQNYHIWTTEEIKYLKENYYKLDIKTIIEHLKLSEQKIRDKAKCLEITWKKHVWTEYEIQFLKENYPKYGYKYCSKHLNIEKGAVTAKRRKLKLKLIYIQAKEGCKICSKCKIEKLTDEFCVRKENNKPSSWCKNCMCEHQKEKSKTENYKRYRRKYEKERKQNDINFKLAKNLRDRIRTALQLGIKKCDHTINILGCSIEFLKKYLEYKFLPGMNWDNYGVYGWHIDHIKPCYSFNLNDIEQQKICFHYSNLQPLWSTTKVARQHGDMKSIGNLNKLAKIL